MSGGNSILSEASNLFQDALHTVSIALSRDQISEDRDYVIKEDVALSSELAGFSRTDMPDYADVFNFLLRTDPMAEDVSIHPYLIDGAAGKRMVLTNLPIANREGREVLSEVDIRVLNNGTVNFSCKLTHVPLDYHLTFVREDEGPDSPRIHVQMIHTSEPFNSGDFELKIYKRTYSISRRAYSFKMNKAYPKHNNNVGVELLQDIRDLMDSVIINLLPLKSVEAETRSIPQQVKQDPNYREAVENFRSREES